MGSVHIKDERDAMWLLLIVLLTIVPGIGQETVLNVFKTYDACQPERNRVGYEMAEAYPGENDFLIVCEYREGGPKVPIRLLPGEGGGIVGEQLAGTSLLNRGAGIVSNMPASWEIASLTSTVQLRNVGGLSS